MGSLRQLKSAAGNCPTPSHEWQEGEYRLALVLLNHSNEYYKDFTFYNIYLILRKGNTTLEEFQCLSIYRYENTVIDTLRADFAEEEMAKLIQKSLRGGFRSIGFPSDWSRVSGDTEVTVMSGLMG